MGRMEIDKKENKIFNNELCNLAQNTIHGNSSKTNNNTNNNNNDKSIYV